MHTDFIGIFTSGIPPEITYKFLRVPNLHGFGQLLSQANAGLRAHVRVGNFIKISSFNTCTPTVCLFVHISRLLLFVCACICNVSNWLFVHSHLMSPTVCLFVHMSCIKLFVCSCICHVSNCLIVLAYVTSPTVSLYVHFCVSNCLFVRACTNLSVPRILHHTLPYNGVFDQQ